MVQLPTRLEGPHAVETRGLMRRFGKTLAVDDLALTVPEGAFYLLIGPNGSGKTTTFRILLGLLAQHAGTAAVCGVPATPDGRARAHIGYVPESHEVGYGWLRVRDLIDHHAAYFPRWDAGYQQHLEQLLEIRRDERFGRLSKGQARRVQLLLALAHRPSLLLLDEPTDGLDPVARDVVLSVLAEHIAETPTTVLAATHLVYEMERLADHVGVIRDGRLMAQLGREALHAGLRRYTFEVPDNWLGTPELAAVVRQNGTPRERRWTVWGEEPEVRGRLTAAGAQVRSVSALTLDEAAVALLARKDGA
jgi:ABC-2 type transport system ATP-binding protein